MKGRAAVQPRPRLPGLRPALPRRAVTPPGPARGSQAAPPVRPARGPPRPVRGPRRDARASRSLEACAAQGLEGVIAKHRRSPLRAGTRTRAWLKIKIRPEQELVVGGWTPGEGNARDLGAVVVGSTSDGDERRHAAAPLRRQGRLRVRRPDAARSCASRLGGAGDRRPAVRPAAPEGLPRPLGRRPARRHLGRARSSSSAPSSAAGAGTASSARRPSRGSRPAATRSSVTREQRRSDERGRPATRSSAGRTAAVPRGSTGGRTTPTCRSREPAPRRPTAMRPPHGRRARRPCDAARARKGRWRVGGVDLKLTNLDKVIFPPRPDGDPESGPVDQARARRATSRRIAPGDAAAPRRAAAQPPALPGRRGQAGLLAEGPPADGPGLAPALARGGVEARDANEHVVADRVGDPVLARQPGGVRDPRVDLALDCAVAARRSRSSTSTPGTSTTWDETLVLARLFRTALGHLGVRGYPKVTGKRGIQVWVPVEPRYDYAQTTRLGREAVAGRRGGGAGPRLLGVVEGPPRRAGPPRLHAERARSRRSSRRTPSGPRPVRPSPRRSPGTSWTTRRSARTAGRSGRCSSGWPRSATCSRGPRRTSRSSRRSELGQTSGTTSRKKRLGLAREAVAGRATRRRAQGGRRRARRTRGSPRRPRRACPRIAYPYGLRRRPARRGPGPRGAGIGRPASSAAARITGMRVCERRPGSVAEA